MKIVLAIDSFKGCLTSEEVEQAVAQCLSAKFSNCLIDTIPIADGGEGTLSTLTQHTQATHQTIEVHNPCMKKIVLLTEYQAMEEKHLLRWPMQVACH